MTRQLILTWLALGVLEAVQGRSTFSQSISRKSGQELGNARFAGHQRVASQALVTTVDDQGFWFSNFTVGASKSLEILLDTGSSDAIMNPGIYKPSSLSKNTGRSFSVSYATTNPDGSGSETARGTIYLDVIGLDQTNLTVKQQTLGAISTPASPPTFPHDGLIGFAGQDSSSLQASPWFHSLCNQKSLAACRFGMAFGTDGTGQMTYGTVDTSSFNGELSTATIAGEWQLSGDIAVNGKVIQSDAQIATDSGTTVIFGPIDSVREMFQAAGMTTRENPGSGNTPTTLDGFYDCSDPPQLGFGFPSASQAARSTNKAVSANSTIFNVLPSVLAQTNNNGNCTAVIHGTDEFQGTWLVGQAFFQGHYIDHNVDAGTMGFATLN